MKNKKILGCVSLLLCSPFSMAMQPMDDQSLSDTTGQDGINIGVQATKVQINQAALVDTNGAASIGYGSKASVVVAGQTNTPVTLTVNGASNTPVVGISIDTDGGGATGKAFANISAAITRDITGIKISPFALYLAGDSSSPTMTNQGSIFTAAGAQKADVKKFLMVGSASNNFEIAFHSSNKPKLNIQLGNVPQSHMMMFSGAIQSICGTGTGCPITLVSDTTTGPSGATFDFQLKATDSVNGFSLNKFHAGVESGGLVFGNYGATATEKNASDKVNVSLNNVIMGTAGQSSSTVFNGLANGSMGSFGAVGASVTNLKMKVSGM